LKPDEVGAIASTEVCDISCVMCHFNGPLAPRKSATLAPDEALAFMTAIPKGRLWFAATGEFLMDPNALVHLRNAVECGHEPCILSNGQLFTKELIDEILTIGVRMIRFSVDAYDPETYRKIRRGGELAKIVSACHYLRSRKKDYPELRVEVNNVLFRKTFGEQDRFVAFWRGLVDAVNFNAEYYNTFQFRNLFFDPGERVDCHLQLYLLPTGQMAPCCAVMVHQHTHNLDWLPHIRDTQPQAALDRFQQMYDDPSSPLANLCKNCQWWVLWKRDERGNSPYFKTVEIDCGSATWPSENQLSESRDLLKVRDLIICEGSSHNRNSAELMTPALQWWYAAMLRLPDRATDHEPLFIRVEAQVENGAIGIGLVEADLSTYCGREIVRTTSAGATTFDFDASIHSRAHWLVIRNLTGSGRSSMRLSAIRAYRLKRPVDACLVSIETPA
jgi:hypothetical protein